MTWSQLLADAYAEQGPFLVVVPGTFLEIVLNVGQLANQVYAMRIIMRHRVMRCLQLCEGECADIFAGNSHGISRVGMVGYCYGGFFCQELAKEGKVDAFVTNHTT